MRAFVAMRNYITTTTQITAELSEIRAKLALLERADEDNAEAVRDTTTAAVLGLLFAVFALIGYLIAGDKKIDNLN